MFGRPSLKDINIPSAGGKADSLVVFLHGLGDTPAGWASQLKAFGRRLKTTHFLLPCAPEAPCSCNGGMKMTSWMDLLEIPIKPSSPDNGKQQEENIKRLHDKIDATIKELGIQPKRVILGGFSQGAALSLAAAIRYKTSLGGCVVLSGWALPRQELPAKLKDGACKASCRETRFLVGHGTADGVVLPGCGRQVAAMLDTAGCDVTANYYPGMGHSSCEDEMEAVADFIAKCLA